MKKKATRKTIAALVSLAGVFVVACNLSKNDIVTDGTAQANISTPSETYKEGGKLYPSLPPSCCAAQMLRRF